jgi:hypothetical protein
MAYSFPPNPTINQTYTSNGKTWKWTGVQWTFTTIPTTKSSPVYVSISPPPRPVSGSLWYDSTSAILNMYYVDLNGGQWISVVPDSGGNLTQQGGVFEGAIYAQYEIPNNDAAFVTVGWVKAYLAGVLAQDGYIRAGQGTTIETETANISSIDSGLVV